MSHDQVKLLMTDLIHAVVRHRNSTGSLRTWLERAVREKIVDDFPRTFPHHSNMYMFTGDMRAPVYLPERDALVTWVLSPKSEIRLLKATMTPGDRDFVLWGSMRAIERSAKTYCIVHIPFDSNNVSDVGVCVVYSDAPEEEASKTQSLVEDITNLVITRKSKRDRQVSLGPSDLANPCDVCLSNKIQESLGVAQAAPDRRVSLKAWVGTSAHQKVERDLPKIYPSRAKSLLRYEQEVTEQIGHVPGLGNIHGHIDLAHYERGFIGDWKTADLYRIHNYQLAGPPQSHRGQTMLYLRGMRTSGHNADKLALVYIPRDSELITDIYVTSLSYDESVATGLLNRAQEVVEVVRSTQAKDLVSDPDCFVCNVQPKLRS